jgi:hypothetical protein
MPDLAFAMKSNPSSKCNRTAATDLATIYFAAEFELKHLQILSDGQEPEFKRYQSATYHLQEASRPSCMKTWPISFAARKPTNSHHHSEELSLPA